MKFHPSAGFALAGRAGAGGEQGAGGPAVVSGKKDQGVIQHLFLFQGGDNTADLVSMA